MNLQFLTLSLLILYVLHIPILVYAGTFYKCIDKDGHETLSDYPVNGKTCKIVMTTSENMTSPQGGNKTLNREVSTAVSSVNEVSTAVSSVNETTKVILRGNTVSVPVTLVQGSNEANIHLILDTGAAKTAIYTQIAEQLYLNPRNAKKVRVQVADGNLIDASIIMIDSLKIGNHIFRNRHVLIIPFKSDALHVSDGLLGMDLLRELNYTLDLNKQVIIWN